MRSRNRSSSNFGEWLHSTTSPRELMPPHPARTFIRTRSTDSARSLIAAQDGDRLKQRPSAFACGNLFLRREVVRRLAAQRVRFKEGGNESDERTTRTEFGVLRAADFAMSNGGTGGALPTGAAGLDVECSRAQATARSCWLKTCEWWRQGSWLDDPRPSVLGIRGCANVCTVLTSEEAVALGWGVGGRGGLRGNARNPICVTLERGASSSPILGLNRRKGTSWTNRMLASTPKTSGIAFHGRLALGRTPRMG